MSPPSSLLLALVLTASLAGTVFCQDEGGTGDLDHTTSDSNGLEDVTTDGDVTSTPVSDTSDNFPEDTSTNEDDSVTNDLSAVRGTDPEDSETPNDLENSDENGNGTSGKEEVEEELSAVFIVVPVVLVVVIIMIIVGGIIINRRWNRKDKSSSDHDHDRYHEDKYLHGNGTEKVPMPMFEDDVPSVLELEMEDLEQWMNKDSGVPMDSGQGM